jgi:hypothetical protein
VDEGVNLGGVSEAAPVAELGGEGVFHSRFNCLQVSNVGFFLKEDDVKRCAYKKSGCLLFLC